ncbi:hypothetical protein GTQ99_19335 [Kineococcus sp. T13]|uniref:hypothetical protein n=1 Tax=Kineococcus vitellinus TaxID=2696565 RepID=UPI0014133A15|nr:hypothetical protein [Kineococcus vitellinus]NAZ77548.1 hypothetical protein [Kineococcus vitellinus]
MARPPVDQLVAARRPAPAAASASALLHGSATLEVALLAAGLVERRHPQLATALAGDPRHRRQQVADTAALLRAAVADPCRALALAARERALGGDLHVRPGGDPDVLALRHALRVHLVLSTAAAAGTAPDRRGAERYVREQQAAGVLLGAEPDDLAGGLAELGADVARVRAAVEAAGLAPALDAVPAAGEQGGGPASWQRAERLARALVPAWARTGPAPVSAEELVRELRALAGVPAPG